MKTGISRIIFIGLILAVFGGFSPHIGAEARNTPISVNIIVDSSQALSGVKDEITAWVNSTLVEQILTEGDRVTVWSAGQTAKVVFSGRIDGNPDKDEVKKSIRELSASGDSADFSGALRDAASRQQNSPFSYTLLISASPASLSSVLTGAQADLMRFSRVEEFSGWRVLVVGLNLDARIRRSASAFLGS